MPTGQPEFWNGQKSALLIVDDTPENLTLLGELLSPHYQVLVATSGQQALKLATTRHPDLILLDVMMPDMDGYAVLSNLKADHKTSEIPVIFVTALSSAGDEEHGIKAGAIDYITKPFSPAIVLARVRSQLEVKRARDWLKDQNNYLETEITRRIADYNCAQNVTIHALARLAEIRDPETGNHLLRTQAYIGILARKISKHPRFSNFLTSHNIDLLIKSAPLHDIGKVGIPDHILLKPGKLTLEEWKIMRTHSMLGSDALEQAEQDARRPIEFLRLAKEIAHYHHEKWDGSGYPEHLQGDNIPISARLMALADVFDALICRRVYKQPMPIEQAKAIILEGKGTHFDPDIVDTFTETFDEFCTIAHQYRDPEPPQN
jgi:putative two-component system response regulator